MAEIPDKSTLLSELLPWPAIARHNHGIWSTNNSRFINPFINPPIVLYCSTVAWKLQTFSPSISPFNVQTCFPPVAVLHTSI